LGHGPTYSDATKLRIVTLGIGTARQKMVLERWTNPKPQRRTRSPRYGVHRVEGNRWASRNGPVSNLPPEIPSVTIRNFFIAALHLVAERGVARERGGHAHELACGGAHVEPVLVRPRLDERRLCVA
jgi:hypothetical protein